MIIDEGEKNVTYKESTGRRSYEVVSAYESKSLSPIKSLVFDTIQ